MSDKAQELARKLIRNFNDAALEHKVREPLYDSLSAHLAKGTAAQKLGAGIDILPPGKRSCPYHFHYAQEEMFIILEGSGSLRVAGEILPVDAGDMVFIPPGPEYPHQLINTSDQALKYLSISTMDSPEVVEYPDSGKYLAKVDREGNREFQAIRHLEDSVDYWTDEP